MKINEICYAIRIGNPKRHAPYLMIRDENSGMPVLATPKLYAKKSDAQSDFNKLKSNEDCKIVKVKITECK